MFRFKICTIAVLYCVHVVYSSTEICTSYNSCRCVLSSSSVIDLSSVGLPGFPRFHEVALENMCNVTELYSYNPCFAFDLSDPHTIVEPGKKPCAGAAACIKRPGGANGTEPEEHAIGLQKTAKFGSNGTDNYINYTVDGSPKILMVYLRCTNDSFHVLNMIDSECGGNIIALELSSKCACPNGCYGIVDETGSSGMSTGSKLLIAFFTIVLAYLIIGFLWNFCNGAKGVELLPNIEFWNEVPTLIMEGVVFTCSCFSRNNSYGEV